MMTAGLVEDWLVKTYSYAGLGRLQAFYPVFVRGNLGSVLHLQVKLPTVISI